jgi:hypothetical protein
LAEVISAADATARRPAASRQLQPLALLAARHIAIDTHVARYFCCVDWEPHLRVAFDARLHVADAVHRELKGQCHSVPKINEFLALPRYWDLEQPETLEEHQMVSDLQRGWEERNGLPYDAYYNLGEAEALVICARKRNRDAGWTFVTNDHDATDSAKLLRVPVCNPFFLVALFVHQGYIDQTEAWLGYQAMVNIHRMVGFLWLGAKSEDEKVFRERLGTVLANV